MKQDDYKLYNKTILKMKTKILSIILSVFGFALHTSANEKIYVNREVTTHIVMSENIKLVDISTTKIIGNQCADNIVRIKPFMESDSIETSGYQNDELLGTVTLIGERRLHLSCVLPTCGILYQSRSLHARVGNGTLRLGGLWKQPQVQPGGIEDARHESRGQQHLFHR